MSREINGLIARMEALEAELVTAEDPKRYFHSTYLRTTRAVAKAIDGGGFLDGPWVERWDIAFADLYLDALTGYRDRGTAPAPWQTAFDRAGGAGAPPLTHVLLGMNAHINYDLPQALIAAISPAEFSDPELLERREQDHRRIDSVLASRVADEDRELSKSEAPGTRTTLDRLLKPLNTAATKRFLRESRRK